MLEGLQQKTVGHIVIDPSLLVDKEIAFDTSVWETSLLAATQDLCEQPACDQDQFVDRCGKDSGLFLETMSRAFETYLCEYAGMKPDKKLHGRGAKPLFVWKALAQQKPLAAKTLSPEWSFWCQLVTVLKTLRKLRQSGQNWAVGMAASCHQLAQLV